MPMGYRAAPQLAHTYPRAAPAPIAYFTAELEVLSSSMDLKRRKQKSMMPNTPTVSSSKKPSEVLLMWEEFKARKRAENNPTAGPP